LTGRPRLPPKAFFGLALSDKGNDHLSTDPSDEQWWRKKITAHRNAGFPLDHIVNDNRWRAGGGQRCLSRFEWDTARYPKPAAYAQWIKNNGLISTLDLNRCIAVQSEGWKTSFNLPETRGIEFNTSAPDLTKKEVRDWFWKLFWTKSLNPALQFPGDALWIDEFDEMGKAPLDMKFENGTSWQEMRNYWFFLVAKSLVQQGWDTHFKGSKRPFVWVRGMTAGAQRYATLWSGDIRCTYAEMKTQVRGMQLAGLSGFPFWGHDAGGFYLDNKKDEPNDTLYRQWSMAFGSFTPYWKPHGMGKSRWPLDRPVEVQKDAHKYSELRYKLLPYLYSYAHLASTSGLPIARSMVLDHQLDPRAWTHDLQYMWGNEILVAPACSPGGEITIWFPKGLWYNYWNDHLINGDKVIQYDAATGKLPLFVKAGAIIPMANFALSTAFIRSDTLNIHVYTGKDGHFILHEDDGVTENYLHKKEKRTTSINFNQSSFTLKISPAVGSYQGATRQRAYRVIFHGLKKPVQLSLDGKRINGVWNAKQGTLEVQVSKRDVTKMVLIM
ncbi:MAG: glycoside hydrolase family 31 protein, partial [Flavitalea sp.]